MIQYSSLGVLQSRQVLVESLYVDLYCLHRICPLAVFFFWILLSLAALAVLEKVAEFIIVEPFLLQPLQSFDGAIHIQRHPELINNSLHESASTDESRLIRIPAQSHKGIVYMNRDVQYSLYYFYFWPPRSYCSLLRKLAAQTSAPKSSTFISLTPISLRSSFLYYSVMTKVSW